MSSINEQIQSETLEEKQIRRTLYAHFDGDLNGESMPSLFEQLNLLEPDQDLCLYYQSDGGTVGESYTAIHALNREAFKRNVHIVFPFNICSSAFDIFLMTKECEKTIFPSSFGMIHEASMPVDILSIKFNKPEELLKLKSVETINDSAYKRYKDYGVSKEHIEKMRAGEDVYLQVEDLEKILKFQKDNLYIRDYNVLY